MSEYWLSHKKYFCKYCEIYITDDAPSRRQHEAGLRHKGNRERFVRNLYKQGERRNKDLEEEKREMARVEAAANAAFARDVSSGHASLSSSPSEQASHPAAVSKKPERPSSQWANYTTAQSLGITDPDEERMKAEMERRRTQGVVGEWEVVAPPPPPLPNDLQRPKEEDSKGELLLDSLPQKREAETSLDGGEDVRHFKLRKRTIGEGLGEIWDPGNILIKVKSKAKSDVVSIPSPEVKTEEGSTSMSDGQTPRATSDVKSESSSVPGQPPLSTNAENPKWQPMRWKRATESTDDTQTAVNEETDEQKKFDDADPSIKKEDDAAQLHPESSSYSQLENGVLPKMEPADEELSLAKANVKVEDTLELKPPEPTGGLFRKRKVPAGARGRR